MGSRKPTLEEVKRLEEKGLEGLQESKRGMLISGLFCVFFILLLPNLTSPILFYFNLIVFGLMVINIGMDHYYYRISAKSVRLAREYIHQEQQKLN